MNLEYLYYYRLGHVGNRRLQKLYSDVCLDAFDYEPIESLESCIMGKSPKFPFLKS